MADIKYQIKGSADTSPLNKTSQAIELLSNSASGAQDTMATMEGVSRGSVTSIFSLARAIKALWVAIQAGQMAVPIIAALSAVVMGVAKAWEWYTKKQEKANEKLKEYGTQIDALRRRMRELLKPIKIELNLDKEMRALDELTKKFERLKKAQEDQATFGQSIRQSQTEQRLAEIDQAESRDPNKSEKRQVIYDRQRLGVKEAAETVELEAQRADNAERILATEREIAALREQQSTPAAAINQAQLRIARIEAAQQDRSRGVSVKDMKKSVELGEQLKEAKEDLIRLTKAEEERQRKIGEIIKDRDYELQQLRDEKKLIDANAAAMDARNAAERELLNLRDRQATISRAKDRAGELREVEKEATEKFEKKYALATDPAARAAQRKADREKYRKETKWARDVKRAEAAANAPDRKLTKHQQRILQAEEQRVRAKDAGVAAKALEERMAGDIERSRTTLEEVKTILEQAITIA